MSTRNPYRCNGPTAINFSGGRTSGFMLAQALEAHGGTLPPDAVVCFANTGLEHPATYDFVQQCADRWKVEIHWIEYRPPNDFAEVTSATASRNGEPFAALIGRRQYLPNPVTRFCTTELKIRAMRKFLDTFGWEEFDSFVGLRADEPRRVARIRADGRRGETVVCPIAQAGHTLTDVMSFWARQPFDLQLPDNDNAFGNCRGCFLKGRARLERVFQKEPDAAAFWIEQEAKVGATFRIDRPSYAGILHQLTIQGRLFDSDDDADLIPCACTD